jgi:hypothetical protein
MNAYTPAQLLALYQADLNTWAMIKKAKLSIAKDPWHVLELLAESPAGLRLILHWAGDDSLGDQNEAIGSANHLEVIVSYNLGLTAKPDAALTQDQPNRPALLKLVSDIRERVLSLFIPDAETAVSLSARYSGCETVTTPEGLPLAAYKLKFEFDAAFPDYDMREAAE